MYLVRLALKNALRKPRRTLLTSISVVVGVFMVVCGWALLAALDNSVVRGQIRSDTGHFRVMAKGHIEAMEEHELSPMIEDWTLLAADVARQANAQVLPRLSFWAELSDGQNMLHARGIGVQPEAYFSAFDLDLDKETIRPPAGGAPPPIWIGAGLAEPFGLSRGATVTVTVRSPAGAIQSAEYVVAGIVHSQNPAVDGITFFVPLESAQKLLAIETVTELVGFVPSADTTAGLSSRLGPRLSPRDLMVETWQERAAPTLKLNEVRRRGLSALVFLIMLVAATGIANTMIMSCFERVREIGTLRALGMQPERVATLFIAEAAVIGLIGSLIGVGLALAVVLSLKDGIDFSRLLNASGGVAISTSTRLYPEPSAAGSAVALLIGLLVTVLAALYPSMKYSKLSAVEAMRR